MTMTTEKRWLGKCGHLCRGCGGSGEIILHNCLNGPCTCAWNPPKCGACAGTGLAFADKCCLPVHKSIER